MHGSDVLYGSYIVVTVLGILVHLFLSRSTLSIHRVTEIVLVWMLVVLVGISGIIAAVFHLALPEFSASAIGWEDSPFQREVGFADLGIGIAGVLCARFRHGFWWATSIITGVFLFGDGIGHIYEMQTAANNAQANTGLVLITDLFIPITLLVLLTIYSTTHNRSDTTLQPAKA